MQAPGRPVGMDAHCKTSPLLLMVCVYARVCVRTCVCAYVRAYVRVHVVRSREGGVHDLQRGVKHRGNGTTRVLP